MASIRINETDNTVVNPLIDSNDNIVFVPGNAVTGPIGVPTLCKSYEEFISTFGDYSPNADDDEVGTSWEYAANLLQTGEFYVLFERVAPETSPGVSSAVRAMAYITAEVEEGGSTTTANVGTVSEIYGGSFGNQLSYEFTKYDTEIRLRVYRTVGGGYVKLDDLQLLNISGMTDAQIKTALVSLIGTGYKTRYVELKVTDESNFFITDTNKITLTGGVDPQDSAVAAAIPSVYSKLSDMFLYDVKFLTSANYYNTSNPTVDYINPMRNLAETRKDCTVFANIPIALDKASVQNYVQSTVSSSYVTFHAPWAYTTLQTGGAKWMAPSFIALVTLAKSVKMGYKIYQAPAGVNRASAGMVQRTEYEIGSATLDDWQNTKAPYVNPIMYLLKYGYVIYGQRTSYMVSGSAYDKSALQELTVRLTANEIKRKIRTICLGLTFEANNVRTWNSFRGQLIPFLNQMKEDGGLEAFKVVMDETTTTPEDINNNRIVGIVSVVIPRAAEDFVINFTLEPAGTTFEE